MNLDQTTLLILETIDMSQTLVIGTYLMLTNNKNKSSLMYLGLFLLTISTTSIVEIVNYIHINFPYYQPYKIPLNTYIIIPIFLLMYIQNVCGTTINKISKIIYLPVVFELLLGSLLSFCYQDRISQILNSKYYIIYSVFLFFYFIFLITLIFIQINKHSKVLRTQYSSIENKNLFWVKYLLISILIYLSISLVFGSNISDFYFNLCNIMFWLSTSIFIIYNGLKQQNSVNLIPSIIVHAEKKNEIMPISEIYENTIEENSIPEKLDEKKLKIDSRRDIQHNEEVFNKIDNLVRLEKLYLNEELTIADIANELKLHPRLISTSINLCYHQNFNRYINSYRVEYAKKLLSSNKSKVVNIEIIGNESGFKSNSSFYNSFKKKYGKTPLQFVKEKREQKE